jgi:hypothetical protein
MNINLNINNFFLKENGQALLGLASQSSPPNPFP